MKVPQLRKKPEKKSCHNTTWEDDYSWIHQNMSEYVRKYQNISEYIRIYQNISEYINTYYNSAKIAEYIKVYQNIPYIIIPKNTLNISEYAHFCAHLLQCTRYADWGIIL